MPDSCLVMELVDKFIVAPIEMFTPDGDEIKSWSKDVTKETLEKRRKSVLFSPYLTVEDGIVRKNHKDGSDDPLAKTISEMTGFGAGTFKPANSPKSSMVKRSLSRVSSHSKSSGGASTNLKLHKSKS